MAWIDLVTLLALIEYFVFASAVGSARERYGIKAPAIAGNDVFERYFRVHQNTLELLIAFIPALWMAGHYWNPVWVAAIGAVYLVGRVLYFQAYVRDPSKRSLGYSVSVLPVGVLAIAALIGVVRALIS